MLNTRLVIVGLALVASACGSRSAERAPEGADGNPSPDQTPAVAVTSGVASPVASTPDTVWDFEGVAAGAVPEGWRTEETRPQGQGAAWSVRPESDAPSGQSVLALVDTRDASGSTFNLAWTDQVAFLDGTVEVKVRAHTGREDQGGGPIWRVQDGDNYYVARWNPLEDNFRVYYVKGGNRTMLETAQVNVSADRWHTITIHQAGNHIEALLDGELLLQTTDDTFTGAGGVGVWTKADAATSFDHFAVRNTSGG